MKWPIFNPINRRLLRPVSISQKDHFKGLYDYVLSILKIWFVFRGALHVIEKLCQKSKQKSFSNVILRILSRLQGNDFHTAPL